MIAIPTAKYSMVIWLFVSVFILLSPSAAFTDNHESDLEIWYGRAIASPDYELAKESEQPLKISKWYTPVCVKILVKTDEVTRSALEEYLLKYASIVGEATTLQVVVVGQNSAIEPNFLIVVSDNAEMAAADYGPQIEGLFADPDYFYDKINASPSGGAANCALLATVKSPGERDKALILAPNAEDVYATQRCISRHFIRAVGLSGGLASPDFVGSQVSAEIYPTTADRRALAVHYKVNADWGATLPEVERALVDAMSRGLLPKN